MSDVNAVTAFLRLNVDDGDVVLTKITFHGSSAENPNAISDAVRGINAIMRENTGHHVATWNVITPDEYDHLVADAPASGRERYEL